MRRGDAGGVTAEFAVALPAVAVVLAACVGGLRLAAEQVRLQDDAALAARALARGDEPPAAGEPRTLRSWREGKLVCVAAEAQRRWAPGLPPLVLGASSCALADGR